MDDGWRRVAERSAVITLGCAAWGMVDDRFVCINDFCVQVTVSGCIGARGVPVEVVFSLGDE